MGEVLAPIPVPMDDDGDDIGIEVDLLTLASFSGWDSANSNIVMFLDFYVEEPQQHLAVIKLSDGLETTEYIFILELLPN